MDYKYILIMHSVFSIIVFFLNSITEFCAIFIGMMAIKDNQFDLVSGV